jgi:mitogen-activated protein kinase kinase kinase
MKPEMIDDVAYQINYALKYLHERNIVHRDIKGANVLLYAKHTQCTGIDVEVKLADFGLSGLLDPNGNGFKHFMGSDDHMAPEIVSLKMNPEFKKEENKKYLHLRKNDGACDSRVDVWALGIIVYNLFMGETPFDDGGEFIDLHVKIMTAEPDFSDPIWVGNEVAKDFICTCLVKDYKERMTSAALMEHPYL